MGIKSHELGLLFLSILSIISSCCAFVPPDNYLIDSGSSSNTTDGNRIFAADSSVSVTITAPKTIFVNASANSVKSFDSPELFRTARVFTGPSSYSFPINRPGRHFIRLYFFSFQSQLYNLANATFNVTTQDALLLDNFGPSSQPVVKEFSLIITQNTLVVSFLPTGPSSFAFINALEVVSVPDGLIVDSVRTINMMGTYQGLSNQALETAYRVNMGNARVFPDNDSLWRTWVPDGDYLLDRGLAQFRSFLSPIKHMQNGATSDTAPDLVYSTCTELASTNVSLNSAFFNVTWQFDIDPSSLYFVRFHYCDIVSQAAFDLLFNVYVGNSYAELNYDISTITSGILATAVYDDFVVRTTDGSSKLRVSIGPAMNTHAEPDAILNGLEILRIMNSTGSTTVVEPSGSKSSVGIILGVALGVVALLVVGAVIFFVLRKKKKRSKKQHSKTFGAFSVNGTTANSMGSRVSNGTTATSAHAANLGYRFPFVVVKEATNNFDDDWVVGTGGFGKVYKGVFRDDTKVAVKRGNPKSQQGLNEFRTEIELLSRCRHRHLVSLIGYCDEGNEMILIYEYMENGTLRDHLYGKNLPNLSWKQRLEICIGSARGLHYLHTSYYKVIIHRDVKSANILLDENLQAKVSDFGLSKTGPELDQTHVSTAVKGSFGYLDPEYFRRQQLTEKSDVYSFGVVLLEVLCARPVINPSLAKDMINLADWAMKWQKRGELDQIVDPRIAGTMKPSSLKKFGETIEKCLAEHGVERPTMGDVLWNLEYVLLLEETNSNTSEENSVNRISELSSQVQNIGTVETVTLRESGDGGAASAAAAGTDDLSEVSMSRVFSQLIKSEGR